MLIRGGALCDVVARAARPGHEDVGASAVRPLEGEPMPLDAAEPRLRGSRACKRQSHERQRQRMTSSACEATWETGFGGLTHAHVRRSIRRPRHAATPTISDRRPWSMERLGAPQIHPRTGRPRRVPACKSSRRRARDPRTRSDTTDPDCKHTGLRLMDGSLDWPGGRATSWGPQVRAHTRPWCAAPATELHNFRRPFADNYPQPRCRRISPAGTLLNQCVSKRSNGGSINAGP